ncbi:LrgB family protein [Vibrio sp.]|uniref:LrgB family protein n=1 Tax=Vibrio viridaestus TaxID=2487322 RepID=A0A3N9TCN9_9VIBR|nr:LrgB family protein [Vibrio viridaestus]MDC0612244.1 LrgB family protein [Vibrio sp.]RQW61931.1 LrgB family protein [Vibrio viridaestus]
MWFILTVIVFYAAKTAAAKIGSPLFNPLLVSIVVLIAILMTFDIPFDTYYAQNSWVSFLLQPAVVALAYPLYEQLPQIRANWKVILTAALAGSSLSMLTASMIAVFLHADAGLIAEVLTKSITTPIAMEVASQLGGEPSIAAILVLLAGLFGAILGYPIYRIFNITHPIAKGFAMGTVSHALGTSMCAERDTKDAAFSSLALVLCGVITSILAPIFLALALWVRSFVA